MDALDSAAVAQALSAVSHAAADEHGCDVALLDGYLPALLAVAATARRLDAVEREACRSIGGEAVQAGLGLPELVDLYMTASRRLWPQLPELVAAARGRPVRAGELMGLGEAVWRAADDALAALAAGYIDAQRLVVRREEASRLHFIDDLLTGSAHIGSLVERAELYGLTLAAAHVVAVVQTEQPVEPVGHITDRVERATRARFGGRGVLVTAREGLLVCVLSTGPSSVEHRQDTVGQQLADVVGPVAAKLAHGLRWRVAVSRPQPGPLGVSRGYVEALGALDIAGRLGLPEPVVHARSMLVYRVLLRDQTAMSDLVEAVLGPLAIARDDPERLLQTLEAYFAAGGNTAAAARGLHLSVRAMTYRLQRLSELTGHAVTDPAHRLTLHVAVSGARLLNWPHQPLVTE